jgi:transcriptional regulator with XRE-family HTH domain
MSIFIERLNYLKNDMTLNAFALKCDIPYSTMRGYFEKGTDPGLDRMKKIANSFNVSVGWLVGEEPLKKYTDPSKPGLSFERHEEIGEELKRITLFLQRLQDELRHAYPTEGYWGRPLTQVNIALEAIIELRNFAEENLYKEHRDTHSKEVLLSVYYGPKLIEKKRTGEDIPPISKQNLISNGD